MNRLQKIELSHTCAHVLYCNREKKTPVADCLFAEASASSIGFPTKKTHVKSDLWAVYFLYESYWTLCEALFRKLPFLCAVICSSSHENNEARRISSSLQEVIYTRAFYANYFVYKTDRALVRLCFESLNFLATKIYNVLICYTKSMISKLKKKFLI